MFKGRRHFVYVPLLLYSPVGEYRVLWHNFLANQLAGFSIITLVIILKRYKSQWMRELGNITDDRWTFAKLIPRKKVRELEERSFIIQWSAASGLFERSVAAKRFRKLPKHNYQACSFCLCVCLSLFRFVRLSVRPSILLPAGLPIATAKN